MLKANRFLGGILLVAGTTIGAGMLALPIVTSFSGFYPSLLLFFFCYLFMLATAFFFLDVNLAVKGEPNLISMAEKTLGRWAKIAAWIFYLLLLYSLTAAYIAASSPFFAEAIKFVTGVTPPAWFVPFSLPIIFGGFVYLGTRGVDYVNRLLMMGLIISYGLIVSLAPSHLSLPLLDYSNWSMLPLAVPVVFTSFGYHVIIPSLVTYMEHDVKKLRLTIVIGSSIPLVMYILWQFLILGIIPMDQLSAAWEKGVAATEPLAEILNHNWIRVGAQFFSFFAIVTSFLGVALSLSDFLVDGFKIKKTWEGRLIACALTFVPPLAFVFTYEKGFYLALQHAGAFVAIVLGILPAMMAWTLKSPKFYRTAWGRCALLAVMLVSFGVVVFDVLETIGLIIPNVVEKHTF